MLLFLAFIFFVLLVVVHEYGHFLVAKRNGVEVEEFGIGFPPKIVGKKLGKGIFESYYTLNWLPLGGFVRLKGEHDADKEKGSYGGASLWAKTRIILAGVFMNFLIALLLFTVLAYAGMPRLIENQYDTGSNKTVLRDQVAVAEVVDGTPSANAGLQVGDSILSLGGQEVTSSEQLFEVTEELAGQTVEVVYVQDGQQFTEQTTLNESGSENGYFGVGPADIEVVRYSGLDGLRVGWGTTMQITELTYKGLGSLFANLFTAQFSEAADTVSGPVGVVVILNNVSAFGFAFMVYFIAVISLTLAIMNSLPIPALDGGRLFVTYLFTFAGWVRYKFTNTRKQLLTPELEERIHGTGFVVLMGLILLISIVDVNRFF